MAANDTSPPPPASVQDDVFKYTLYIVFGAILIVTNSTIVLTVFRHKILRVRKEYVIVASLAFADMLVGWANLTSGRYRMSLIVAGTQTALVSKWHCATSVASMPLFVFGTPLQALMLLVVSLDRLVAVTAPLRYLNYGAVYAAVLVAPVAAFSAVFAAFGLLRLESELEPVTAMCVTPSVLDKTYFRVRPRPSRPSGTFASTQVFYWMRILATCGSVALYGAVWVVFKRRHGVKSIGGAAEPTGALVGGKASSTPAQEAQRRLTTTIGYACIFTIFFYVLPTAATLTMGVMGYSTTKYSPYVMIAVCTNASLNVFLYVSRHRDIRFGAKYLFLCKELPPNFEMLVPKHTIKVNPSAAGALTAPSGGLNLLSVGARQLEESSKQPNDESQIMDELALTPADLNTTPSPLPKGDKPLMAVD